VRRLRSSGPGANLLQEGPEFVTRHAQRRPSRASKCLMRVDFQLC